MSARGVYRPLDRALSPRRAQGAPRAVDLHGASGWLRPAPATSAGVLGSTPKEAVPAWWKGAGGGDRGGLDLDGGGRRRRRVLGDLARQRRLPRRRGEAEAARVRREPHAP